MNSLVSADNKNQSESKINSRIPGHFSGKQDRQVVNLQSSAGAGSYYPLRAFVHLELVDQDKAESTYRSLRK